jgi:hypothetical protein
MSVFDQRNQKVTYQYNVNGTVNFGNAQNRMNVVEELKNLQQEIIKATDKGVLDAELSTQVDFNVKMAIIQSEKPEPSKNVIEKYLETARQLLSDVGLAVGLVKGVSEAIEVVRKFF